MTVNHWMWLFGEICGVSLVAGPAGASVFLMWKGDEHLLDNEVLYED